MIESDLWLSIDWCLEANAINPSIHSVDLGSTVPFAGSLNNPFGQHGEIPEPVSVSCSVVSDSVTPCTGASQAPLCVEFSRQEYWSGLLFLSPGGLPYPGI